MKHVYENFSCQIFPGFYESLLYNSDTLYYHDSESLPEGFCWKFVKGGYTNFCKETCKEWVHAISENFEDNPLGMTIGKYKSMWSPREYNFTTDKISFEVQVDLRKLKKFCFNTERSDFDQYLHDNWSSYDGFISFIPNNVPEFMEKYMHDKSLVDIMIEYYLLFCVNFEGVEYDVLEEDWSRIHENVTLEDENGKLWDYEWDNKLEEYRNPIIYPSEYEGKKVYGMNDWHGDFGECFCPGDLFTVEIAEHFLECVPPEAYSQTYVQCGEPYSHVDAGGKTLATYTTFEAVKGTFNDIDSVWRYCGHCFSHEREEYKGK